MKALLTTPWPNAWIPLFKRAFEKQGIDFECLRPGEEPEQSPDIVIHGWMRMDNKIWEGAVHLMYVRRYELYATDWLKVPWQKLDGVICVNDWIADHWVKPFVRRQMGLNAPPVHVIYNGVDPDAWTYKDRNQGKSIGMACHVHPKKNLPLALQIMAQLPGDYQLHIAGAVQDRCTLDYLNHMGRAMKRRVLLYDEVPHEQMDMWWEMHQYCLSTSISEGNPNNVIEAMAKGIRPVVHRWPGADRQFAETHLFECTDSAAAMIKEGPLLSSHTLRELVKTKFSLRNYDVVVDLALELHRRKHEHS